MQTHAEHFDPYHILDLPARASTSVIKSHYRRLSLKHHPDKNPGNRREAGKKFNEVAKAYKVKIKTKRGGCVFSFYPTVVVRFFLLLTATRTVPGGPQEAQMLSICEYLGWFFTTAGTVVEKNALGCACGVLTFRRQLPRQRFNITAAFCRCRMLMVQP